jgi:hypothetical protein
MMKTRICFAIAFLAAFLLPGKSFAQFTSVSATVLDPLGIPFAGGTMTALLVPNVSGNYTLSGAAYSGRIAPTALDSTGSFTVQFADNGVLLPASSQWQITICAPQRVPPPLGTGGLCFTAPALTITGGSQNISVNLNAAATALSTLYNPSRVFNTLPAAGTASIGATTMTTAPATPATGTRYNLSAYISQTVLGASCAGNSTIVLNAIFQDPNAASAQTTAIATFTVTTNGTLGIVPITANPYAGTISFTAKAGTAVQYSTTYTPGGSCAPAPAVQLFPVLELQ